MGSIETEIERELYLCGIDLTFAQQEDIACIVYSIVREEVEEYKEIIAGYKEILEKVIASNDRNIGLVKESTEIIEGCGKAIEKYEELFNKHNQIEALSDERIAQLETINEALSQIEPGDRGDKGIIKRQKVIIAELEKKLSEPKEEVIMNIPSDQPSPTFNFDNCSVVINQGSTAIPTHHVAAVEQPVEVPVKIPKPKKETVRKPTKQKVVEQKEEVIVGHNVLESEPNKPQMNIEDVMKGSKEVWPSGQTAQLLLNYEGDLRRVVREYIDTLATQRKGFSKMTSKDKVVFLEEVNDPNVTRVGLMKLISKLQCKYSRGLAELWETVPELLNEDGVIPNRAKADSPKPIHTQPVKEVEENTDFSFEEPEDNGIAQANIRFNAIKREESDETKQKRAEEFFNDIAGVPDDNDVWPEYRVKIVHTAVKTITLSQWIDNEEVLTQYKVLKDKFSGLKLDGFYQVKIEDDTIVDYRADYTNYWEDCMAQGFILDIHMKDKKNDLHKLDAVNEAFHDAWKELPSGGHPYKTAERIRKCLSNYYNVAISKAASSRMSKAIQDKTNRLA